MYIITDISRTVDVSKHSIVIHVYNPNKKVTLLLLAQALLVF